MRKNKFNEWFKNHAMKNHHLYQSLEKWQITEIKDIAYRAYKMGKKVDKLT